jgi:iron complex transport system substrate-binding protein
MKPESLVGWSLPAATVAPEDEFAGSRAPSHGMDDHLKNSAHWVSFGQFPDLQPDAIVAVINFSTHIGTLETQSANLNAPLIVLRLDSLADYSDAFELLGQIMGEEPRAAKLSTYLKTAISKVRAIIPDQPGYRRVHLYCDDCATIIEVNHVVLDDGTEFLSNFVILQASNFAHNLHTDRHWHNVKAAAFGRVHSMPNFPFSWIDDRPSLAQVLTIEWLASEFYPQSFPFDLKDDTKRFYQLFLNVDLSDQDVEKILN